MAEVKLLGMWASPFSRRVEIALKLKGVEYEHIEEYLSNKSPLLLQCNPIHKKVPVLLHKGKAIAESIAILEYIDETWKNNPILPTDPYERALARFWAKFIDEKMPSIWNACWCEEKDKEVAMSEAYENLKIIENELKNKRFFGGDNIGIVDIVANFFGLWLGAAEEASGLEPKMMTEENFPNLCRWRDEYINCSVIKEVLPPKDEMVPLLRTHFGSSSK